MGQQSVSVGYGWLERLIMGHEAYEMTTDFPDDAHIVAAYPDPNLGAVRLIMESAEWLMIPEGHVIPEFRPRVTVTNSELEAVMKITREMTCPKCGESV